jgi:glycerol-1-phosphate dehydrogenase [NAD(P)+]
MEDIFESLLNKEILCECGKTHYIPIKRVMISKGILNQLAEILNQLGFLDNFHLVADKNTFEVAANRVEKLFKENSIKYSMTLFNDDDLVASDTNVEKIKSDIDSQVSLIIAVGSGTINDLCRYAAFQLEKPYLIIATAPSMDGYASSVSPLIINGFKNTYNAVSPIAIIGDMDIIKNAPAHMIAAGFGDLIGKYISLTDWKLSKCINDEYYCDYVAALVYKSLTMCVENTNSLKLRDEASLANLMKGLVLSGLGMLMIGNSRPASGAEHHLAHFWEMCFLMSGRKQLLHGQKVGVASVLMAELYNSLNEINIIETLKHLHSLEPKTVNQRKDKIKSVYGAISEEVIKENFDELYLPQNTDKLIKKWEEILEIAKNVPDSGYIKSLLDTIGAPSLSSQLGIDKELESAGMENCMYVRKRYTILRLFDDLGLSYSLVEI